MKKKNITDLIVELTKLFLVFDVCNIYILEPIVQSSGRSEESFAVSSLML